jgi:hypothetical protein
MRQAVSCLARWDANLAEVQHLKHTTSVRKGTLVFVSFAVVVPELRSGRFLDKGSSFYRHRCESGPWQKLSTRRHTPKYLRYHAVLECTDNLTSASSTRNVQVVMMYEAWAGDVLQFVPGPLHGKDARSTAFVLGTAGPITRT